MTTIHSGDIDCPIAPFLSVSSARLRSLILKGHLATLNAQLRAGEKADPHLARMILLGVFLIFRVTGVNFDQYLHIHGHPDAYSTRRDADAQTEHAAIRTKRLMRTLSNGMRSEVEEQRLDSCWPSDDNDDADEDLRRDPPEALIDDDCPHRAYACVSFWYRQASPAAPVYSHLRIPHLQRATDQHPSSTSPPPNSCPSSFIC